MGDGKLVLGGFRVEGAIVDVEPLGIVRLANKEDRSGERGCAGADDALGEHLSALPLYLNLLKLRIAVQPHRHQGHARQ